MNDSSSFRSGEYDLNAARRRIRRRSNGYGALVLGPVLLIGALAALVLNVLVPHVYPAGDLRNDPLFWLAGNGFIVVVIAIVVVGNLRARAWRADAPESLEPTANPDPGEGNSPVRR